MKGLLKRDWSVKDVFHVFVSVFVIELALFLTLKGIKIEGILTSLNGNSLGRNLVILSIYILQVIGFLLPLWFFALRKKSYSLKKFGFIWIGTGKTVLWVLFAYLTFLGLTIFLLTLFFSFGIDVFGFERQQSLFDIFGTDVYGLVIASFIALLIAPFVEEIFFRGFMLQTLVKKIGKVWGIIITTLIFAAVHFEFGSIMPLIILSLILSVLFIKTESIWPGIIFHIFNNSLAFTFLYLIEIKAIVV